MQLPRSRAVDHVQQAVEPADLDARTFQRLVGLAIRLPQHVILALRDFILPGSRFDLALVYSSLQYVDNQAAVLRSIAGYRPRYIVLSRLMATRRAVYVTRQRVHGFHTPCKVASLDEVSSTLVASGYRSILSVEDGIDLSPYFGPDVPETLRVGFEHLLVFRAADA